MAKIPLAVSRHGLGTSRKGFLARSAKTGQYVVKPRASVKSYYATVQTVHPNGTILAVTDKQSGIGFKVEDIRGYAGEPFEEIGLARGAQVRLVLKNGDVLSAELKQPA